MGHPQFIGGSRVEHPANRDERSLRMTQLESGRRDLRSDIAFAFGLALACYVAWLVRDVLLVLYVSALLAVVLRPIVRSVSRLQIGRWRPFKGYAILVLLLLVAGLLTLFGFLALP